MNQNLYRLGLLFFLPFCMLSSCHRQDASSTTSPAETKINLRKADGVSHLFLLTSVEQFTWVSRYEDCIVFLSLPGCTHCAKERNEIEEYVFVNHCLIYEVSRNTYVEAYEDETNEMGTYQGLYPTVSRFPTYLFFKEGKLVEQHTGGFNKEENPEENGVKEELDRRTDLLSLSMLNDYTTSKLDDITYHFLDTNEDVSETSSLELQGFKTDVLDNQIHKEKTTVLFTWRRCGDCASLRKNVLDDFLLSHPDRELYYYEVDGYYSLKRNADSNLSSLGLDMWADFSRKYHFYSDSYYNTDRLGNKAGVVPTFVTFENGVYQSMDVYLNEMDIQRNDDGSLSYAMAFHPECLGISSDTKVKENDTSSEDYSKARKELSDKALQIDIRKAKEYLSLL